MLKGRNNNTGETFEKHNIKCYTVVWSFKHGSLFIDKSYETSTNSSQTSCNF